MIKITTSDDPDGWKRKREPLFSIDGEEHTVPVEVPGSITLQAMEMYRQGGDAEATPWLMRTLIGEDGYAALLACPSITKTQLKAIHAVIREKVMGDPEDPDSEPGKGEDG